MTSKQYEHIKKRIKKRQADFGEIDLLVKECDHWKGKAASYHFLLEQIWRDDPILRDGPDTLGPDDTIPPNPVAMEAM